MAHISLLPDWTPAERVILALPTSGPMLKSRIKAVIGYAAYLKEQGVPVSVLTPHYHGKQEYAVAALQARGIELLPISASDIWIRDWAPLLCKRENELVAVKFRYPSTYPYNATKDNAAGVELADKLGINLIRSKLIWEMGNFSTNGKVIIATDQVLHANNMDSAEELKNVLVKELNYDPKIEIYILELNNLYREIWELFGIHGDYSICHIDGLVRFVKEDAIVYHSPMVLRSITDDHYMDKLPEGWNITTLHHYQHVCGLISSAIYQFVHNLPLPLLRANPIYSIVDYQTRNLVSQEKNTLADEHDYLNFLRYGADKLFLPCYGTDSNKENTNAQRDYEMGGIDVIPVHDSFVDELAQAGGVLNCASWVKYVSA